MADLQERYLHAIRRALPAAKADDIVAELRDVLATRQEEREDALDRPLTENETAAMLKEFGHPLVVAARYRPQQWLIGPDVFPFYWFVIRIVMLVIVGVEAAGGAARVLFNHESPFQLFAQTWGGLCVSLLISVGVVTIVFAIMERAGFPADHVKQWKPQQLPAIEDTRKSVWESAFEIGAGVVAILWWVGLIHIPWGNANSAFRMEPAPIFMQLYWPVLALMFVRLVENLVDWIRPGWRLVRGILSVGTTFAGLALLALLYRADEWVVVTPLNMPAAQAADLARSVNLSLKIAIVVAGVVWAFQGTKALWELMQRRHRA